MRNALGAALAAMLIGGTARAQELSVFVSEMRPGTFYDQTYGAGGSIAGYVRFGSAFAPESRLSRINTRLGVRVAYSEHRASQHRDFRCTAFAEPCQFEPHIAHSRLVVKQASLLFGVINRASTRVEIGAGMGTYSFSGETTDNEWGVNTNVTASRRVAGRWWAMADYALHGVLGGLYIADAPRFDPPNQSLRLGVMYRVRRN